MPPLFATATSKRVGFLLRGLAARQLPTVISGRQYPLLVVAICALLALMVVPWVGAFSPETTLNAALGALLPITWHIVLQMSINYYLRYGNNRLRRWLDHRPVWLNILLRISLMLAVVGTYSICHAYYEQYRGIGRAQGRFLSNLAGSQILAFFIIVFQFAIETLERSQAIASENEQLRQEQLEARYESLKQQLSPHFLFNSLSTLGSLIDEAPAAAQQFVEELAEVYRYSLQHGEKTAVSLWEEVTFLRSYLYLLQMRFGESLDVHIDLPEVIMDRRLPPLALQLLVENVVKHNVFTRRQPLRIAIEFEAPSTLLVRNTWQPRQTAAPSSGVGLSNLTNRIRMLHQQQLLVKQSVQEFQVFIPLPPLPLNS
jgi:hypothetical protein